jgi:hypothetical protein
LITANTPQIGRITLSDNYTFSDQRINHKFTAPVSQYHDDAARTDRIVRDRFIEVDGLPVTVVAEELVEEARPYIIDSSTNHHEPIIHHSDATNNYYSQYEMRNYRRFDGTILENVRIDLADFYAVVIPPVQPANPGGKTITHNNGPSNEFERFGQFLGGGSCNVM